MSVELPDIAQLIWETKYRYTKDEQVVDRTIEETWARVARAVASREKQPAVWQARFMELLADFRFLPGGRVLANAGTDRTDTTMFNCYVMGSIPDSIDGIFQIVKESALTQKQGGGVGFDFSSIRPKGSHIRGVDSPASGPLSFMRVLDATCRTIMSAGQRRGAQMGIMRCDHPDIEEFIEAKREEGSLRMFNLSVAVTDKFMQAVRQDADWDLVFDGRIHKTVKARALWDRVMRSTYDFAEPGVFMVDRVNHLNNLYYCETIRATNPCGEQPLPPYGACLLGSVNLTRFVRQPFTAVASVDEAGVVETARLAVRFLDNVIELSRYPLPQQEAEAKAKRRMGLGITGLADMLIALGLRYGSEESVREAERVMKLITLAAYEASSELATERGPFPAFDAPRYLEGRFVCQALPEELRARIARTGLRNSHLTSIAPTGTISLLAGNVSSGIEPVFAFHYVRSIRRSDEKDTVEHEVMDYAYWQYCRQFGRPAADAELPSAFVSADHVTPRQHIDMQAALQAWVDSSISKTINVPAELPFDEFRDIYTYAYDHGLKGCTTFRPSEYITGVLRRKEQSTQSAKAPGGSAVGTETADLVPVPRPRHLHGTTYKVKTPLSRESFYVTINDLEEDGRRRPYEIFVNTKNLQHFSWIVAITRMISAIFRLEKDPAFLVEELVSIYDPAGGYFSEGEYVPSLPAELGRVIQVHLKELGLPAGPNGHAPVATATGAATAPADGTGAMGFCPSCQQRTLVMEEGCLKCRSCGYSKCG